MSKAAQLKAMKLASFDWTLHLQSVWEDLPYHIEDMQPAIENNFRSKLGELNRAKSASPSPLGWVLAGAGGVGKTHLLGALRAEAARQGSAFIMVDMTDVNDFWETVVVGYTGSLQEPYINGRSQHHFILENLVRQFSKRDALAKNLKLIVDASKPKLKEYVNKILSVLANRYRRETGEYKDVIRALVATNSDDFEISNLGQMWLQGLSIDNDEAKALGFYQPQQRPKQIVKALSWLISLGSPAVVAFDQMDPIVRQLEFEVQVSESSGDQTEQAKAKSIISGIGDGLSAMFDVTRRTLTVLSCLESSWNILENRVLSTATARYERPKVLKHVDDNQKVKSIIEMRMEPACQAASYDPPYPTWPFPESALNSLVGVTPRELLKRCSLHRQRCLDHGSVNEVDSLGQETRSQPEPAKDNQLKHLDEAFQIYSREMNLSKILDEKREDQELAASIRAACQCLLKECPLPSSVHAVVDTEFTGGKTIKPLHARIRLIFHEEEEREEHYCVRALERTNATAYQNRLKLAMTQSGIDKALKFRQLTLLRTSPQPGGKVTASLAERFASAGGAFHNPSEQELRILQALRRMAEENDPKFEAWLQARRPASQLEFCKVAFVGLLERFQRGSASPETGETKSGQKKKPEKGRLVSQVNDPVQPDSPGEETTELRPDDSVTSSDTDFPLGRRLVAGKAGDPITIPIDLLEKHVVVLAGAGSGKTVLLKRMIEEAACRGVPSIVIDGANDLSAIGDRWPASPGEWTDDDATLAERYHQSVDKIIWTPGKRSGNQLRLELLPDLTASVDDPDELDSAVAMVSGALADILKLGSNKSDQNKRGILSKSLRFYIEQSGCGLLAYIELLADLPADAMLGINNEAKLARELSDGLRVLEETDPMITETGDALDPAVLFGDDRRDRNTRISVINLGFLSTSDAQQRFVNQLATTLFAWIKTNPNPPGRSLRGLLIIDEAKDLVPARKATPCKESLIRLAAQARKYHLAVVFATQNPREIDNAIIGNCSTQYYGKASSPAAINTIREQLSSRGGSGDDIGRLEKGTFYVFNADADMRAPTKVRIPLCLSHHQTLDGDEVLERAIRSEKILSNLSSQNVFN